MADHAATKGGITLSNTSYDVLRRVVEVVLPGLGAMYFTIAQIWGLPYAEEVVGTIAAVTVFLALVLGLSRRVYQSGGQYDGEVVYDDSDPQNPVARLQLDESAAQSVLTKDKLVFKGLGN